MERDKSGRRTGITLVGDYNNVVNMVKDQLKQESSSNKKNKIVKAYYAKLKKAGLLPKPASKRDKSGRRSTVVSLAEFTEIFKDLIKSK